MRTVKKSLHMSNSLAEIITRPGSLEEARQICNLQHLLMDITEDTCASTAEAVLSSTFVTSEISIEKLARNIFFAARFRAMAIESLSSFVVTVLNARDRLPHVAKLKDFLSAGFIEPAFHDEFSYKETWRYFFLYHLMRRGAYTETEVVALVAKLRKSDCKKDGDNELSSLYKIMAAWFAPEIEKHAPSVWKEYFEDSSAKSKIFAALHDAETRVFDILEGQSLSLSVLKENDWAIFRRSREIGYTVDPLIEALINDDADSVLDQINSSEISVNSLIEPSLFSRSTILQDSSSPLFFAAGLGRVKCFKMLLLNQAELEHDTWNEYATTLASFAVAGGNSEIVRLVKEAGCSFDDAVYVAAQYHRNKIFHWIYDSLNMGVDKISPRYGSLMHRAAKSNNVELALYLFEQGCDINKPIPNHDFFDEDRTPPLSEAIQFRAIDVAKLCLVHRDLTLVQQEEKQDSLIFETIYYPNHEILPLFLQHKTLATALSREKKNYGVLLARCKEFQIPELISFFDKQLSNS